MVLCNEKYEDITISTVYIIDTINQTHSLQLLWYYIFLLIKWYNIDFVVIYSRLNEFLRNFDILMYKSDQKSSGFNYFWHNKIMLFYFTILSMNTERLSPCHFKYPLYKRVMLTIFVSVRNMRSNKATLDMYPSIGQG